MTTKLAGRLLAASLLMLAGGASYAALDPMAPAPGIPSSPGTESTVPPQDRAGDHAPNNPSPSASPMPSPSASRVAPPGFSPMPRRASPAVKASPAVPGTRRAVPASPAVPVRRTMTPPTSEKATLKAVLVDAAAKAQKKAATVEVTVTGLRLIDPATVGERARPGEGHLHYRVDDGPIIATTAPKLSFHALLPGDHTFKVMLTGNNHMPLGPQATLSVNVPE